MHGLGARRQHGDEALARRVLATRRRLVAEGALGALGAKNDHNDRGLGRHLLAQRRRALVYHEALSGRGLQRALHQLAPAVGLVESHDQKMCLLGWHCCR